MTFWTKIKIGLVIAFILLASSVWVLWERNKTLSSSLDERDRALDKANESIELLKNSNQEDLKIIKEYEKILEEKNKEEINRDENLNQDQEYIDWNGVNLPGIVIRELY